jgi:phage gpG-like protein
VIAVELVGDEALRRRLQALPARLHDGLQRTMARLGLALQQTAQRKVSGEVLQVRSGTLRASITAAVTESGGAVTASVGSDAPYAAIHEYGGTTRAHLIEAKNAQSLAFLVGGRLVFAKRVFHPGSHMPERSFLRSALAEMAPEIAAALAEAAGKAAQP